MPVLTKSAEYAASGCLVKPLFHQWIMEQKTAPFNLLVERPVRRGPDGWFHASSHPLATDRELYLWMTGQVVSEPMDYVSLMSVMFGTLAHAMIEAFLDWMGVAVPLPPGECPACGRPRRPLRARPSGKYCTEHGYSDARTRARCHLDSILDFSGGLRGFDLKTIWPYGLKGAKDMDAAFFTGKWPHYWAQMQECMRLSGLRRYIVFFVGLGNPWETREYHFDFDPEFAMKTEEKYLRVLSHVERKVPIIA